MNIARVTIEGISPYSSGKYHRTEKLKDELPDAYEMRTWRERLHYNKEGYVFIPAMAFTLAIIGAAKHLSEKIPGKRNQTWTKHFTSGLLIINPLVLPIKKENVEFQDLLVPADGKPGGGTKVMKRFSIIHKWGGLIEVHVLSDIITKDVFVRHFEAAGQFIGVGVFRPQNRGYFGRFKIVKLEWAEA